MVATHVLLLLGLPLKLITIGTLNHASFINQVHRHLHGLLEIYLVVHVLTSWEAVVALVLPFCQSFDQVLKQLLTRVVKTGRQFRVTFQHLDDDDGQVLIQSHCSSGVF